MVLVQSEIEACTQAIDQLLRTQEEVRTQLKALQARLKDLMETQRKERKNPEPQKENKTKSSRPFKNDYDDVERAKRSMSVNEDGFIAGDRVRIVYDRHFRFGQKKSSHPATTKQGKVGTVKSVTAKSVYVELDDEPGNEFLKRNHNVALV